MSQPPDQPKIYHITHISNLARMLSDGVIWSDARMIELARDSQRVGLSRIKQRRLQLKVSCNPGTMVGQYVPFYFCTRSIMLYLLHQANDPDLDYKGGQKAIIHLEADLNDCVNWAILNSRPWAFTPTNAGANYTLHFNQLSQLDQIDWKAVAASDFRSQSVKDGKQAEFLLFDHLPCHLIDRIGVKNQETLGLVSEILQAASLKVPTTIQPSWYF